jgi:hypothetical protein
VFKHADIKGKGVLVLSYLQIKLHILQKLRVLARGMMPCSPVEVYLRFG